MFVIRKYLQIMTMMKKIKSTIGQQTLASLKNTDRLQTIYIN